MDTQDDARFAAALLLSGAVLSVIGNALHPLVEPEAGVEAFLQDVSSTGHWLGLHLFIVMAVALLVAGVVLLARWLRRTQGGPIASLSAVFALLGGTLCILQIGATDGYVLSTLADEVAAEARPELMLLTASGFIALNLALLSLWVGLLLGATFLALGVAMRRAGMFARWTQWMAIVTGSGGVIVSALMFLQLAPGITFLAFRVVALSVTVVAIVIGVRLYRGNAVNAGGQRSNAG